MQKVAQKSIFKGSTLRAIRKSKKVTIADLCEKIEEHTGSKIYSGMVSRWENELVMPRIETIQLIADILEVELIELLNVNVKTDIGNLFEKDEVQYNGRILSQEEIEKVKTMLKVILD